MDLSRPRNRQQPKKSASEPANNDKTRRTGSEPSDLPWRRDPGATARQTSPRCRSAPARTNQVTRKPPRSLPDLAVEKIGLLSLEPNLARVSHKMNQIMSQEAIYRRFIFFAFFDNDDPQLPVRDSHFHPLQYQHLTHAERLRLQKDILECRWFTLDRYRQCLPTLLRLAVEREWGLHRRALRAGNCRNQSPLPALDDWDGLKTFFHAVVSERDPHSPLPDIPCPSFIPRRLADNHYQNAVGFLCVPSRALKPRSWNNDAIEHLFFVTQARALKPEFELSALFQGIETAIVERSYKAMSMLRHLVYCQRHLSMTSSQQAIPGHLFRLACQQGDHSSWILSSLISAREYSIPLQKPATRTQLTEWASQQHSGPSGAVASWILRYVADPNNTSRDRLPTPRMLSLELCKRDHDWVMDYDFLRLMQEYESDELARLARSNTAASIS